MSLLAFHNVSLRRGDKDILRDISFALEPGDFMSVVGRSGSGKSTLLKVCSHLISPTSGHIIFNGHDCEAYDPIELRQNITYCFQTPILFGRTVKDNIDFLYQIRHAPPDTARVHTLLRLFHMPPDILNQDVSHLSGGEKQRLALIRNLLFRPKLLLLDEVTSSLDADNTRIVENVIASLNKHDGVTIVWVTHDRDQSKRLANIVLTLDSGTIASREAFTP